MAQLPAPLRAAIGLAVSITSAVREARGVPDKALELPVLAVGAALQLSVRAQQRYAALTIRGDEFLTELRGGPPSAPDEPPEWAQFDDDADLPADAVPAQVPVPARPAKKASAATATADHKPAPARKTTATPAVTPAATPRAAKKPKATTAGADAAAPIKPAQAKKISSPRTGKPSAFDRAADSADLGAGWPEFSGPDANDGTILDGVSPPRRRKNNGPADELGQP